MKKYISNFSSDGAFTVTTEQILWVSAAAFVTIAVVNILSKGLLSGASSTCEQIAGNAADCK